MSLDRTAKTYFLTQLRKKSTWERSSRTRRSFPVSVTWL